MRIAFAGTPEFAAAALRALLAAGHDLVLVLTQPDRPAGRGMKLQASAVKSVALDHGLAVAQPRSLRLDGKFPDDARAARDALDKAAPEVMVVAAYGLILPAWVLAHPPLGCLNIHGSILPRWRGAAPIHRAIEAGDTETGITLMQMDAGLDTGDMLDIERVPIGPDDTTALLHDRLAALGARMVVRALTDVATLQALVRTPQPSEGVTYAHKVEKAEAAIDWSQPAEVIERRVRAFDAFPGMHFQWAGEAVKLWRARLAPGAPKAAPGEVLAADGDLLRVACGTGSLDLVVLQCPGGRRIATRDFLATRPLTTGDRLG
ncbi:methionyl-tRNA formyltransferase [Ideonella sp. A 288]|uniref:methionyl-tRNA formyltransferase n=1 Tax=Ideonella sp. A 288 TaxID=1962181 RepID=UPI000B4B0C38|nr:methionyl-tRNA formyltransferase [Ideonella sp. A 288]